MNILSIDEQALMKEVSDMSFKKLQTIIKTVKYSQLISLIYQNLLEWCYSRNNTCASIKYDSSFNKTIRNGTRWRISNSFS